MESSGNGDNSCGKQWEGELPRHGSEHGMLRHVNTCLSMEVNPVWNGHWPAGALRAADLLPAASLGCLSRTAREIPGCCSALEPSQSNRKDKNQELKSQEEPVKPEELCKTRVGVYRLHKHQRVQPLD